MPEQPLAVEKVGAREAVGRVCARDLAAPDDLPGFDRSSMDGYAVRAADTFGASEGLPAYLELKGEVLMGSQPSGVAGPGEALAISTGGVLPGGTDAVVMVEQTQLEGTMVEVSRPVAPGENVIRRDEDVHKGAIAIEGGRVMGPGQVGLLAALGFLSLEVYARPRVGIISTGDEVIAPDARLEPGKIRDVNSSALAAAVELAGCTPVAYGIVADSPELLFDAASGALGECDALIISGGSSAGARDHTLEVMERLGSPGLLAHGLYLRPGKPTLVAVCGGKPVLGFPGNPASALAVFEELFLPVLRTLRGEEETPWSRPPRVVRAVLDRPVPSATGRLDLIPVTLAREGDRLVATPVPGRVNLIGTLSKSRGNVRIPRGGEGLPAGAEVKVELLD